MASLPTDELSDQQKATLQEFRKAVSDLLNDTHDDNYLLRWLRARKFDLQKSEKMLRDHVQLWKKLNLGSILTNYELPEVVNKYTSYSHIGFDRDGHVVMGYLHGITDFKGLVYSLTLVQHVKALVYMIEDVFRLLALENQRTGRTARRAILIVDCHGLKMQQFLDKQVAKRTLDLLNAFQANYPETLRACYVINVPGFFYFWYNFAKGLFDPDLVRKFKIYGTSGWREVLLDEIGPQAVPGFYGGAVTDPDGDPECRTMFIKPEKVPESYYLINNVIPVTKDPEMKKIVVRERAYFNLRVQVKLPEHVIRWRFQTLYHDIRYGLYYVPEGIKPMPEYSVTRLSKTFRNKIRKGSRDGHEMLLPLERIESHIYPEEGEFHCDKIGTYFLHFDNTFSWMTPKELYYKVEVLPISDVFSKI